MSHPQQKGRFEGAAEQAGTVCRSSIALLCHQRAERLHMTQRVQGLTIQDRLACGTCGPTL